MAKNNSIIKNEGSQGNLFKALIRAIKPSKPSIMGWVSLIFYLNRLVALLLFYQCSNFTRLFFCRLSNSFLAKSCLAIFL
jgi:hypothetical protein